MPATTTISYTIEVEVDEHQWAASFGGGDAYDRAEVQRSRSLVADVESYIHTTLSGCGAADEGAIVSVEIGAR